jgi:serine O-acetyltransferase
MGWFSRIREDIESVKERDPAAHSLLEILLCYPGLHAIWGQRITHWLWVRKFRLLARFLSQFIRLFTGVEIHPGAVLGHRVFMDHGMGIVIGETAIVGNDVTLYQGVTLGGTGKQTGKRHPTLRNGVVVGNNANILGNIVVGENSRVGAGSVVLQDVPPDSTVVGVPGHIVYREGKRVLITDPHDIKDPLSDALIALSDRVNLLQKQLDVLNKQQSSIANQLSPFAEEYAERAIYREEQEQLGEYVFGGEGI